jgi:hypothetical protein
LLLRRRRCRGVGEPVEAIDKIDSSSHMKVRDVAPTSRVIVVAIMVSIVAFLDSTVVDGYLLALAATILPGGSISDL